VGLHHAASWNRWRSIRADRVVARPRGEVVSEGYQRVASLSELADGTCLAVEVDGLPVVLVRSGDRIAALENRCPHAGAPLSEGFVEGPNITCSWHGWSFDLASGRSPDDPSAAVPVFEVKVEGGEIFVRR
jgi:3-phenylpropionate/trans-cinnamate dioxygenase ferredoxin subunit